MSPKKKELKPDEEMRDEAAGTATMSRGFNNLSIEVNQNPGEEQKAPSMAPKLPLMYHMLLTKDVRMPAKNSRLCTKLFCVEVKDKVCYSFMATAVVKSNVIYPPPVKVLHEILLGKLTDALADNDPPVKKAMERLI